MYISMLGFRFFGSGCLAARWPRSSNSQTGGCACRMSMPLSGSPFVLAAAAAGGILIARRRRKRNDANREANDASNDSKGQG